MKKRNDLISAYAAISAIYVEEPDEEKADRLLDILDVIWAMFTPVEIPWLEKKLGPMSEAWIRMWSRSYDNMSEAEWFKEAHEN